MALKPIRYPLTDGNRHSWHSLEAKFAGKLFLGFTELSFGYKRNRTIVYGAHPLPLGKTRGKVEFNAKAKLYLAEFIYFTQEVLGGRGYGDKFFTVNGIYQEVGFDSIRVQLNGCTLDEAQINNTEGSDPTAPEITLNPLEILINGVSSVSLPMPNTQSAA